jgi:hypothetical protein
MSQLILPIKTIFAKLSNAMIEKRRKGLELFLSNLLTMEHGTMISLLCVKRFLDVAVEHNDRFMGPMTTNQRWAETLEKLTEKLKEIRRVVCNGSTRLKHHDELLKQLQACSNLVMELGDGLFRETGALSEKDLVDKRQLLAQCQDQIEDLRKQMIESTEKKESTNMTLTKHSTTSHEEQSWASRRVFGVVSSPGAGDADETKRSREYLQVSEKISNTISDIVTPFTYI